MYNRKRFGINTKMNLAEKYQICDMLTFLDDK